MDVPIAVAIFLASIISIFEAITKGEHAYFDSVIMLIFFLLIGRYLDFSARRKAFSITGDLMMLAGISATIILNNKHKIIASKDLQKDSKRHRSQGSCGEISQVLYLLYGDYGALKFVARPRHRKTRTCDK